jgi:hypothetical protein
MFVDTNRGARIREALAQGKVSPPQSYLGVGRTPYRLVRVSREGKTGVTQARQLWGGDLWSEG